MIFDDASGYINFAGVLQGTCSYIDSYLSETVFN